LAQSSSTRDSATLLREAIRNQTPLVALLGQKAGWGQVDDPVLAQAFKHTNRSGTTWRDLLNREATPEHFYEWLAGRFERRIPPAALEVIASAPFSAIFTSSIDPGIANLFATGGREPDPILLGTPQPRVIRSFRRPPVYYLFGRAGSTMAETLPPTTVQSLTQRRIRHATSMLQNLDETATPLGLILVEGYQPKYDWLRAEELLAVLSSAPKGGVIWFGESPEFLNEDDEISYQGLIEAGIIIPESRSLAEMLVGEQALIQEHDVGGWGDPELITLSNGATLVIPARLRLVTQASASIIDDSWTSFIQPLSDDEQRIKFLSFHGSFGGIASLVDGVRRGFAINRDFEKQFHDRVERALLQHHNEGGAIILHGQSGVGKSIALARLSVKARNDGVAVLFAQGRLPQPGDISDFLQAIDQLNGLTLIIADSTVAARRYDDLLRALRSAGHRVVVVGSSYRIDKDDQVDRGRFIEAPAVLSPGEKGQLNDLLKTYSSNASNISLHASTADNALARFYRLLPESRERISLGLGREMGVAEQTLRTRGQKRAPLKAMGTMAEALIEAGFPIPTPSLLPHDEDGAKDAAAALIIDYVMAASRLFKSIPIGLLLRAVASEHGAEIGSIDTDLILDLFRSEDIFRWKYDDEEGMELLIGARLQIEAEIVCNRRLGGASAEARALIKLIRSAFRAGPEDSEETRFVADIVHALGPDGPAGDRYRDQYADIGRALTELRTKTAVMNGRLMLQESALRRAHVRMHSSLLPDEKAALLVEAVEVVDGALAAVEDGNQQIFASRRTREHLLVERAATYGFLATDAAHQNRSADEIWSSYKAAREATRLATGRVDSYHPLDIALWTPARILREASQLQSNRQLELQADIWATLDMIDPSALDPTEYENFQRQRMSVAEALGDPQISDEAFEELERVGSTVGFFIRAKMIAPPRNLDQKIVPKSDIDRAAAAAAYLRENYSKILSDPRCLQLMISLEWLIATRRWLFTGARQPIPANVVDRTRIRTFLQDLTLAQSDLLHPRYRYLEAVVTWLDVSEDNAIRIWRELDRDTKFVEAGRVVARHVLTDDNGQPRTFDGLVERRIGPDRWSIYVEQLSRHVDLVANSFKDQDLALGRMVRNFAISFNYRGPLADRFANRWPQQ